MERNIRHFRQAEHIPLAGKDNVDKLGFGVDTEYAEKILDGTVDLRELTTDKLNHLFLQSMTRRTQELKITLTKEKMIEQYRIWKERTTTSLSGRHLNHFRALLRPFKSTDDEDPETIKV